MTTTQSTHADATDSERTSTDARGVDASRDATAGPAGEATTEGELPLDLVFESLKNSRRRQVLRYLRRTDSPASVSELAEHVAAIENDTTVQALSSQQRKRVYVGLYQCHLPKLDDADVVAYDDDRGTVELGENAPQLSAYLDVADGGPEATDDRPWPQYYLGVAGGAVVVLLAGLGFGGVGPAALLTGLGFAVGLAALAVTHRAATA